MNKRDFADCFGEALALTEEAIGDDMDDLIQRLRHCRICSSTGQLGGQECPRCSPDDLYHEAATALESLQARNRTLTEALRELVELKDLKNKIQSGHFNLQPFEEAEKAAREYRERQPLAWINARKALSQE